jgi:hypothetical protein
MGIESRKFVSSLNGANFKLLTIQYIVLKNPALSLAGRGSGLGLGLFRITSRAKSRPGQMCGPGLARPGLQAGAGTSLDRLRLTNVIEKSTVHSIR